MGTKVGLVAAATAVLALLLSALPGFAAGVVNVKIVEQPGGQYVITYDLEGNSPVPVLLMGSEDGGKKFDIKMEFATGDIGDQVAPGKGKRILWDAKKDFPKGTGNIDLTIDVIAGYRSSVLQEVHSNKSVDPVRTDADYNQDLAEEQERIKGFIEQRKNELEDLQQEERRSRNDLSRFDGIFSLNDKQKKEKDEYVEKLNAILKKQDVVRSKLRQLEKDLKQIGTERRR